MAIPWPSRTDWPLEPREHATELTKYPRDTLNCIDRSQGQAVPANHVRTMITGTLTMISKTLRTLDLTTIQDALNIMQTEAKDIAEETANVIETVKMEMRNSAANIKRSIKIGEETKTAAREATERSKMVVDMVKELKDKAPPVRTQGHMSYAAVAAHGVLASGTPDAHRVKAASLQAQREVIVSIEVQRLGNFASTVTTGSTENDSATPLAYKDVDWRRLREFEVPPPTNKRYRTQTSFVWAFGWRIFNRNEGVDYWLCRICHHARSKALSPTNPNGYGSSHAFICTKTTSTAIDHLREKHRIGKDGPIEAPPSIRSTQPLIEGYCEGAAERNRAAMAFDLDVFMGLLLLLVLNRQLPLSIVDAPEFRQLLIYLQPRLQGSIPSTRSLKRYIATTYDSAQRTVESELQRAFGRVNLSFDLWTSLVDDCRS
jgi:hypothetical protein